MEKKVVAQPAVRWANHSFARSFVLSVPFVRYIGDEWVDEYKSDGRRTTSRRMRRKRMPHSSSPWGLGRDSQSSLCVAYFPFLRSPLIDAGVQTLAHDDDDVKFDGGIRWATHSRSTRNYCTTKNTWNMFKSSLGWLAHWEWVERMVTMMTMTRRTVVASPRSSTTHPLTN